MLSFSEFMRQVWAALLNDERIKRNLSIPADSSDGDRSPSEICYRDDAQLLGVFESNVSEYRHVVLRRHFYPRSVAGVVPELRCASNSRQNGGVCSDDTPRDSDVKRWPAERHARFYRARRDLSVVFLCTGTALSGGFFGTGGNFASLVAFALNDSKSACLLSVCE